jgi:hypothetical protein
MINPFLIKTLILVLFFLFTTKIIAQDNHYHTGTRDTLQKSTGILTTIFPDEERHSYCTGTFFGENLIITAASCVINQGKLAKSVSFRPSPINLEDKSYDELYSSAFIRKGWIGSRIAILEVYQFEDEELITDLTGYPGFYFNKAEKGELKTKLISHVLRNNHYVQMSESCYSNLVTMDILDLKCDLSDLALGTAIHTYFEKYDKYFITGVVTLEGYAANIYLALYDEIVQIRKGSVSNLSSFKEVNFETEIYHQVGFENTCNRQITMAFHYRDLNNKWLTKGFYTLAPFERKYFFDTNNRIFYYSAASTDGSYLWKGNDYTATLYNHEFGLIKEKIPKSNNINFSGYVHKLVCTNKYKKKRIIKGSGYIHKPQQQHKRSSVLDALDNLEEFKRNNRYK